MPDDTDVLLFFCNEYWEEIRHTENQRATLTNLIILIASAVLGLFVQWGLSKAFIPLAILLILLGLYGAAITLKLYERYNFLQNRLYLFYNKINDLHPNAEFLKLRADADAKHKEQFPKLSRMRVHQLWLTIHAAISIAGIVITILILYRR